MSKRKIRRPAGFGGKELQGFFMIANQDAATAILNKLTGSQLRLWLYLMMADSFADLTADGEKIYHPIPSPQEIAIKIGVSPDTVEKDVRKLKKLGLYDYRITAWHGHNLAAAKAREESERLKQKKAETPTQQGGGLNKPSANAESLEKSEVTASPQTIQTYSDFKDSLSEGEREKFFDFVREQIKNLPQPVNDLEAWLASQNKTGQNRWEVYYQNFSAARDSQPTPQSQIQAAAASARRQFQAELEQRRQAAQLAWEQSQIPLNDHD